MKSIISSTYDDKYLWNLPLVTYLWNKLGVDVICFMPSMKFKGEQDKIDLIIYYQMLLTQRIELFPFTCPEHKEATYSQCARLYAACLDLPDNEQLIISDVDMGFFSKDYIQMAVPNIIDIYGADLVPDEQFPMCYLSGYVKTWRDIIGKGSYQEHLDRLLGGIECEHMRGNYWGKDQQTIWELLTKAANETSEIDYITHNRARPGTQFAKNRYDRDDAFLLDRLSPGTIDYHLPRPGYEENNFNQIMTVLQYHYPQDNFSWLREYNEAYKKIL